MNQNKVVIDRSGYIVTTGNNIVTCPAMKDKDVMPAADSLHLDAGIAESYPGTGNTWFDISGNSNNFTLLNGTAHTTDNRGTFSFDGIDDYATGVFDATLQYGTSDFSLDIWFHPLDNPFANHAQYIYSQAADGNNYFVIAIYGQKVAVFLKHTTVNLFSSNLYDIEAWNHLALTRHNGVTTVYLNAVAGDTSDIIADINETYAPAIGSPFVSGFGTAQPYRGQIATIRIAKDKGISADDVTSIYNGTKARFGL